MKTPKTDTSERKVYIPKFLAQILVDIKKEQDELKDILGSEYQDYNLVMATTFGLPIGDSYLRDQMQKVIDEQGLPDVVFHSLRHPYVKHTTKNISLQKQKSQTIKQADSLGFALLLLLILKGAGCVELKKHFRFSISPYE